MTALVLAAGRSHRFGTATKQVALLGGRPLVRWPVETAAAAGVDRIVVVVGHDAAAVGEAASRPGLPNGPDVDVVVNERYASGQGSSLVCGVAAVRRRDPASAVVVLLADQPGIRADAVRAVAAALRSGAPAARASYTDGPSHPVGFAASTLSQLTDIDGDRGARDLLDDLDVAPVLVAGAAPTDVDTPEDLARLRAGDELQ